MKGAKFSVWLPEADFTEAERTLSENRGKRLSLLMLGRASQAFESNIEMLRVRGYHVVPAETSQQMSELLESPEYNFVGALLLVETAERDCYSWWRRLVQNRNNFKSILHISGCNQDELDTQFINQFDLIVNTEMSEEEIINRINKTFKEIASA
jgi:response regulator RpfG family c-di-GMP phosphodiesterase